MQDREIQSQTGAEDSYPVLANFAETALGAVENRGCRPHFIAARDIEELGHATTDDSRLAINHAPVRATPALAGIDRPVFSEVAFGLEQLVHLLRHSLLSLNVRPL